MIGYSLPFSNDIKIGRMSLSKEIFLNRNFIYFSILFQSVWVKLVTQTERTKLINTFIIFHYRPYKRNCFDIIIFISELMFTFTDNIPSLFISLDWEIILEAENCANLTERRRALIRTFYPTAWEEGLCFYRVCI